jgi:plastocyanin
MARSFVTGAALIAAAAVAASCGGGSGGGSSTPTSPSAPAPITITIRGQNGTQAFDPNPASAGGQQVVFRNNDSVTHRVVLNDGSIDTGDIAPGATSRAVTMPGTGTNYHCSVHPGMIGAVAASGGAAAPPCEGAYCTAY